MNSGPLSHHPRDATVFLDDDWTTKYVKIMDAYNMVTLPSASDTKMVIDGVGYCNQSSWIKAGFSLDGEWDSLFDNRKPKTRKVLAEQGLKLSKADYQATINMVLNNEGELQQHLNQVFNNTATPVAYCPRNNKIEEFHTEGSLFQTVYAFTDGSAKEDQAGWGVYFKEGSKYNAYGRVTGPPNNYAAELEAIEYALSVAPVTSFLTIFTDSQSAIDALRAAPSLSPTVLSRQPECNTL